jgi:intracellular septation protein
MKLFFDMFPIIVFFIFYKFFNIYVATAATIVASLLQLIGYWLKYRKIDFLLLISAGIIVILGCTTLWLHNEIFIKWKPTAISWVFALAFLQSHFFGAKPLVQHFLEAVVTRTGEDISLPPSIWYRLNIYWMIFYFLLGGVNLVVAYNFDTSTWVNFKVFGLLGLTTLFVILQTSYLVKHMKSASKKSP